MADLRITPKNWGEFQHYKERNPPWIKLHYSLLDNPDFIGLPVASKALAPCIWLLASRAKDGVIELSSHKLSLRLRMSEGEFWKAFKPLISEGFFLCEQDASTALASRTQSALPETETETETEEEEEEESKCMVASDRARKLLDFDDFWRTYPKRCGNNSKAKALEKFALIVKQGIDPATIIAGAERYSAHCDQERETNTRFVQMAITWLNQQGWQTDYGRRTNGNGLTEKFRRAAQIIDNEGSRDEGGSQDRQLIPLHGKGFG